MCSRPLCLSVCVWFRSFFPFHRRSAPAQPALSANTLKVDRGRDRDSTVALPSLAFSILTSLLQWQS